MFVFVFLTEPSPPRPFLVVTGYGVTLLFYHLFKHLSSVYGCHFLFQAPSLLLTALVKTILWGWHFRFIQLSTDIFPATHAASALAKPHHFLVSRHPPIFPSSEFILAASPVGQSLCVMLLLRDLPSVACLP